MKEKTVKFEPHAEYKATKESIQYMLLGEDGTFVGSNQPKEVAEEIIHCAAILKEEVGPCSDFDLHITTDFGSEFYYRLCDFEKLTEE